MAGAARPSLETYARLTSALGADLVVHGYPNTGPAIRDRISAPMLEHLLATMHPRWERVLEARVTRPGRGWIDAVLHEPRERLVLASELQSELRRLEQLIRWHGLKADSLPSWDGWAHLGEEPAISRLLAVRRTRATRRIAAEFARQLRTAYPAHPDDAVAALTGTTPWPGEALAWMVVDGRGARWASGSRVRTTSCQPLPARASASSMISKQRRACARTSPTPTVLPSASTGAVPPTAM